MRIGELSKRTGISTSRIRFYEKHDLLPKPARNGNGYRTYPDTATKILELIDTAQQLGFSLNEIRKGLSEAAPNLPSQAAMAKALRSKLVHIDQHMKDVRARRRQIVKLLKEKAVERGKNHERAGDDLRPVREPASFAPEGPTGVWTRPVGPPRRSVAELNIDRRRETP